MGHSTPMLTWKMAKMRYFPPLSILLLAAIGAKFIGPHGDLQVDKQKVYQVTGSVDTNMQ